MNPFQKQLLLRDNRSMAELSRPERDGIGQPLPPARISVEDFEHDIDADYASTPHPLAYYKQEQTKPNVQPDRY